MKMKLVVAAFLATSIMLNAQGKERQHRQGEGEQKVTPEMRVEKMAKHLSLTDAEKAKVLELFKLEETKMVVLKEEMKKLREKSEAIGTEQKAKFEALRKSHDAELEKIVGKEKMNKMHAQNTEAKHKMHKMAKMHEQMHQQMDMKRMHKQGNGPMQQHKQPMANYENKREKFTPERRAEFMKAQLGLNDSEKTALVELFTEQEKQIAAEHKLKMETMKNANDAEIQKIIGKEKMTKFNEIRKSQLDKAKKFRQ